MGGRREVNVGGMRSCEAGRGSSAQQQGSRSDAGNHQPRPPPRVTNIESLLVHTSPCIPVKKEYAISCLGSQSDGSFQLEDLWRSYEEWSAYGAGVPLHVEGNKLVQQYYTPYLSGIQVYAADKKAARKSTGGSSDGDVSDSDSEGHSKSSASCSTDISTCGSDSEEKTAGAHARGKSVLRRNLQEPRELLFQFFEDEAPHMRMPLADRVEALASVPEAEGGFPGLTSLGSDDIHRASWYAVAWYPIYRLPAGRHVRDLGAAFITFHSLSLPGELGAYDAVARPIPPPPTVVGEAALRKALDAARSDGAVYGSPAVAAGQELMAIRPFAFTGYKAWGRTWDEARFSRQAKAMSAAAAAWVERMGCSHGDFSFFSRGQRK